jgi:hypothetical protein
LNGPAVVNTYIFATVDLGWTVEPARKGGPLIEAGHITPY